MVQFPSLIYIMHITLPYQYLCECRICRFIPCYRVHEKLFETSDILSDIDMLSGGHSSKLWLTFSMLLGIFSVFLSDIMSDVLGENVRHSVQNVGHVRMSDYFSYSLLLVRQSQDSFFSSSALNAET